MKTAVLLCRDGVSGPDRDWQSDMTVIDGLCQQPELIVPLLDDSECLVLGLCGGEFSLGAIQAEVRKAGIDPLSIEIIDLTSAASTGQSEANGVLELVLKAKVARAEVFGGSSPVNAKITFPRTVNRRDFFRGRPPVYQAAPSIDPDLCTAESGCRACVEICPQIALSAVDGRIHHDRSVCEPCGLCVTRCPVGAVVNPVVTPAQLEAEITVLLDPLIGPPGARGIIFSCSRGAANEAKQGWYSVTVPCTAMVPPGWLLAPLLMGAGSVICLPCSESGCRLAHDPRTIDTVEFCRELLDGFGESPERISGNSNCELLEPLPRTALTDPFGSRGVLQTMQIFGLAHEHGSELALEHVCAPTGIVELHSDACTACARCAQICPTGALESTDHGERVAISFDAARCTACSQCLGACPELVRGAISLKREVDMVAISTGRRTLIDTGMLRCESCGGAIAPAPMMERITSLLGSDQAAVRSMITSRCITCRGISR